jgi:hypothetical protein
MTQQSPQGRAEPVPVRISLRRQQLQGEEALHVMCFEKRTLEQVGGWYI